MSSTVIEIKNYGGEALAVSTDWGPGKRLHKKETFRLGIQIEFIGHSLVLST